MAKLIQWVNLEKDDAFAKDADIGSKERCGPVDIKLTFKEDDITFPVTVKVTDASPDNAVYNADEQKRNKNFRMTNGLGALTDTKEFTIEESIHLPAAGGNTYKVEAIDDLGTTVASQEVETKRKLYYQTMKMSDSNGTIPSYSLATMEAHADKHFIKLQKEGAEGNIPYRKNINFDVQANLNAFGADVARAFNINAQKKPVGIATVFIGYISSYEQHDVPIKPFTAAAGSPEIVMNANDFVIWCDRYYWHGIDDDDDRAKNYFVSGELTIVYQPPSPSPGGSAPKPPPKTLVYNIPKANIDIEGTPAFSLGGYNQIKVKKDAVLTNALQNVISIDFDVKINIPKSWTIGFSWNTGVKLITCSSMIRWEPISTVTREYTWNHEVGHRFGMTAHGNHSNTYNSRLPDAPSTLYSDNLDGVNYGGHRGPHCGNGVTYNSLNDDWAGAPVCVMFGADGTQTANSPKDYCPVCEPIVRKVDLSA